MPLNFYGFGKLANKENSKNAGNSGKQKKKSKNAGNSLVEQETKLLASYFLKISEKYQNLLRRYRVRVYNSRKLL